MTNFEFQIDNYMLYCASKNLSKKTMKSYEQTLKLFAIYLQQEHGIEDVQKVKTAHIRHYIKYLQERGKYTVVSDEQSKKVNYPDKRNDYKKEISRTTIANYLRNIKVFMNFLHKIEREIKVNPAETIENIKPQRKQKKLLSEDELRKVVRQFDVTTTHGLRNACITRLLLDTGMRISECLDLFPEDIDFRHKSILVKNPKNNQQRYVYFSTKMSRELKQWLQHKDRYCDSEYLFPTIRGTKLQIRNFEKSLKEAGRKVGVDVHPHKLRNCFSKYFLLQGGDWASLARILGHSDPKVTMDAYLDFTDEEIGKKYQKHSPLNNLDI